MQIFVTALDGETLTVETATNTTDDVKQKIEKTQGVPAELQRLIFEGKELEDGRELSYYNVRDGSTLHLTMDLEGGGWAPLHLRRLALWHLVNKKFRFLLTRCRKCYGRLPPSATRCQKAKCGRTTNIRNKKLFTRYGSQPIYKDGAPRVTL